MKRLWDNYSALIIFIIGIVIVMLFGCGPSAEERVAMEKAKQDSIEAFNSSESSGQLLQVATPVEQTYIKCIAKDYEGHISNVDVYLIGADTFVVATGMNGNGVTMIKK